MYKIVNNLVDVHAEHILTPSDNRTRGEVMQPTEHCIQMLMYIEFRV
jgi:hypothetical protein